jgi:DNA-binding response OmpR family regulator
MSGPEQNAISTCEAVATFSLPDRKRRRVLLIEDEPLTRAILLNQFRMAGLDVDVASNGNLALKKLPGGKLDAIFLELLLPDMSGAEIIQEARRDPEFAGRPIYVYTSAPLTSTAVQRAAQSEATKVFDKLSTPVDAVVSEVAADIKEHLLTAKLREAPPADQAEVEALREIPAKLSGRVNWLSKHLRLLAQCQEPKERTTKTRKLHNKTHSLVSCAAVAGRPDLARQAAVLRSFLKDLCEKPNLFTNSSSHTLDSAAEALELLSRKTETDPVAQDSELAVVVVDDDLLSRTAISNALRGADFKLTTFANPAQALEYLATHPADLVVLDVLMPELSGPDLREKLRDLPLHGQTPVIFVASLLDLKRFRSGWLAHSTELVVKPFIPMELALKALSMIMKQKKTSESTTSAASITGPTTQKSGGLNQGTAPWPSLNSARTAAVGSKPDHPRSQTETSPPDPMNALLVSPDAGVIEIDKDRKIIYSSDLCTAMFGWQKLLGQHVGVLLKDGLDNEFGRILMQSQAAGHGSQRFSINIMARRKDGTEFPTSVILTRISSPSKFSWTAVFRIPVSGAGQEGHTTTLRSAHQELQNAHTELQAAHEELKKQYQAAAAEAAVHRESLAKSQKDRERLEQHLQDISSARADLEKQLAEEVQAKEDSQKSCQQLSEELDQTKTDLQKQTTERESIEAEWLDQLNTAKVTVQQIETDYTQEVARSKALERKLASLRNMTDELNDKLTAAQIATQQAEAARQQEAERSKNLEQELASLRQAGNELHGKLTAEQQAAADSHRRIEELESRLRESTEELERVKADLEKPVRQESNQLNAAKMTDELETEMERLRDNEAAHQAEFSELESRIREGVTSLTRVTADLEKERGERRRIEQRSSSLATQLQELHEELKQHLGSERATQSRISELEQQLREREEDLARARGDLLKEASDRHLADQQLQAAGDMSAELRKYLALFEESKKAFRCAQEGLEGRLQTSLAALRDQEAKMQKELGERQRLEETLATAQRNWHEQSERSALELSRLQSELQVEQFERKRLEGDVVQSRYASLDSARVGRALVNSLRRQIRQPVDKLLQSARSLLEVDLQEAQKKLVESMLENTLLLHSSLQETGTLNASSAPTEGEAAPPN